MKLKTNIKTTSYNDSRIGIWLDTIARSSRTLRILNMVFGLIYLLLFISIYRTYLSVTWGYMRFPYRALSVFEWSYILSMVALVSLLLPLRLRTASSVIIWILYAFVIVPTLAITFMVGEKESIFYIPALTATCIVIIFASIFTQKEDSLETTTRSIPFGKLIPIIVSLFIFSTLTLYIVFQEILAFSSVDDVYFQRKFASEAGGAITGYIRTYYPFVFSSSMFVIGLVYRRFWYLTIISLLGYLFMYMIDASKIALIIPVVILFFHVGCHIYRNLTFLFTFSVCIMTGICAALINQISAIKFFTDLFLLRSIAIPAQMFPLYADLFSTNGFTYWSNVRGLSLIIPPPSAFSSNPLWPNLGEIVGAEYFGYGNFPNMNANLFAGEGVAAAGTFGVFVIGIAFISWLRMLDVAARGWDRRFVILTAVPLGLSLANAHLTTFLLSFGGFFWLIIFFVLGPKSRDSQN